MKALIVCYYGGLKTIEDLPEFYTSIFGNRKPPEEYLKEAKQRFLKTGKPDPLYTVSNRQREALQSKIDCTEKNVKVYTAYKHSEPRMEHTIQTALDDGVTEIELMPMSPFYTKGGGMYYLNRAKKILEQHNESIIPKLRTGWYEEEMFQELLVERIQSAIDWFPSKQRVNTTVIFSVHSQPGTKQNNMEFIEQYETVAATIMKKLNRTDYFTSYRSAGPAPQIWLEPNLMDVIKESVRKGAKSLVVVDLLSVTENIEAITDVQEEAKELCDQLDVSFVTTDFLNDGEKFMRMLSNWYKKVSTLIE